jgi:RNA recognition motif-containing protein
MDPKSGSSKGFGFIEMPNVSEAKGAIKNLNYKTIGRNKIRVKTTEELNAVTFGIRSCH